jgi:hypothetical protein
VRDDIAAPDHIRIFMVQVEQAYLVRNLTPIKATIFNYDHMEPVGIRING